MRIGVVGIAGRMGRLIAEEILAAGHALSGGTERAGSGQAIPDGTAAFPDVAALAAASDAVIDFTHADVTAAHAAALSASAAAWVLGTTGLSAADEAAVTHAAQGIPIVQSPNFGPGITLLLALAEQLGAALPAADYDAEVLEMHHKHKVDAPSGTAISLGRAVARGRGVRLEDVMASGRDGHTGPRPPGAIGFAALRGGNVVGEHTVLFAAGAEHIALTHRAFDRRMFAAGAVRAAAWTAGKPPGLYSMEDVMGVG